LPGQVKLVTGASTDSDNLLLVAPALLGLGGLLVAGIEILKARKWRRWRRYIPLLLGLFPLLSAAILYAASIPSLLDVPFAGRELIGHWLSAIYFLLWVALGAAIWIESGQIRHDGPG
ncbi:MAG: hypothetical protein R3335_11410, partial [Anaerolineales bacterium]|nr:hypothetical protein [Anaerolineales bacterium]